MEPSSACNTNSSNAPQPLSQTKPQGIAREQIPPSAADPHPQFASSCLQSAAHSESFQFTLEIVQGEVTNEIFAKMEVAFQFHGVAEYKGKPFIYKNKEDPIHQKIETFIRAFVGVKLLASESEIKIELAQTDIKYRPLVILDELLRFQENFPDLFQERGYQEDVELLKRILDLYKVEFKRIEHSEAFQVVRPVESYQGSRLVTGCGHAITSCSGHAGDYTLNFESDANSDLIADYHSSAYWKAFPDGKFREVFFEGFSPALSRHAFKQMARILAPGGKVRMGLDTCQGVLLSGKERLLKFFQECGFDRFEIVKERYRSNNREDELDMVVIYKK